MPIVLNDEKAAQIAKALSHPARLKILRQFQDGRPRMAAEIVEQCTLAQSTVSEHLRILRQADLLSATKEGARTWYCMRRAVLKAFARRVESLTLVSSALVEDIFA